MKERLRQIRKTLGLSQDLFAKQLGITGGTVSLLEKGQRNFTKQMIKSICREFDVEYAWFTTGEGEMFINAPETAMDELCKQYELDECDRKLITEYIKLDKETRNAIKQYFKNIAGNSKM